MDLISRTSFSINLSTLADAQVGTSNDGDLTGLGSNFDPSFNFAYSDDTQGLNQHAKYPFQNAANSQNNTIYHLRMAEMYLIYAEAESRRVGGDLTVALDRLNDIRDRVGVSPKVLTDSDTLLEDIRQEKLLELFFENGEPWFDLVRYHKLGNLDATTIKPSITSVNQFILPIPLQVIIGNNTIIQNPGY